MLIIIRQHHSTGTYFLLICMIHIKKRPWTDVKNVTKVALSKINDDEDDDNNNHSDECSLWKWPNSIEPFLLLLLPKVTKCYCFRHKVNAHTDLSSDPLATYLPQGLNPLPHG